MSGFALENVPDPLVVSATMLFDTFASCMGQEWPAAREHVNNSFFGMSGDQLDEYGNNLAFAWLPGAGFRVLHNEVTHLVHSIQRKAGFVSDLERRGTCFTLRFHRHPPINIQQLSIESEEIRATDRRDENVLFQTLSSTITSALTSPVEQVETVAMPQPSLRRRRHQPA